MPKRFTDTQKWQDEWFMELPCKYKLFWIYILDNCDHAGIWKVNFKLASFHIGENLDADDCKEIFAGRIHEFKNGYWFLVKFIKFQYGGIKNDAVGKSIQNILNINNLNGAKEGLGSPYVGPKVKDKVKDIAKVKELEGGVGGDWLTQKKLFLEDGGWQMKFCTSKKLYKNELDEWMQKFLDDIELRQEYKPKKELQSHFTNWFNKQKKDGKQNRYDAFVELANRYNPPGSEVQENSGVPRLGN